MKKLLLAFFSVGIVCSVQSQVVLEEDFQGFANNGTIEFVAEPDDADADDWLNIDLDFIPANAGGPQDWFGNTDYRYIEEDVIVGDTNFIMASQSWLDGFAPGNRNYLITPEIEVSEDMILTFSVSTRQGPRYADGLSVVVSPDADMSDLENNFSDVLFRQAQMVEATGWNEDFYGDAFASCSAGNGLDIAAYCWYPEVGDGTGGTGYVHADSYTLMDYLILDDAGTNYVGTLEPHTVSLADYVGETIRIAFLHDSDDDNLIGVDDIIVEVETANALAELSFNEFLSIYPNPATEAINLDFSVFVKNNAVVNIYDSNARLISSETYAGSQLNTNNVIDISNLTAGVYSMQVVVDGQNSVAKNFMKR